MSIGVEGLLAPSTVGVAIALVLAVATHALLPAAKKSLARQPMAFVALHLFARVIGALFAQGSPGARIASVTATLLLFASYGRSSVLLALDVVLEARLARPLPRIFRDIVQGVVYVVMLLVALRTAGVEPGSILTTSALLTAAIALSLQETLGNLVAGLAIQAQRPFDEGDWIQFDADPKHIGRVLEINWRATKVITLDEVEVIVPNATLAKAPITNFTKPSVHSRRSLYVQIPAEIPPHAVRQAILKALPGAFGVLDAPAPSVVTNAFLEGNVEYWIRFFTDKFHMRDGVDSAARDRVWYALARARIPVAGPNRVVRLHEVSPETQAKEALREADERALALSAVDFLRVLSEAQQRRLAEASRMHQYGVGEAVVRQGDQTAEMFIVKSGEVVVERENGQGVVEVARLGPGTFFGEMALMTGEKRTATVRASIPSTLIGVDQAAIEAVLNASPDLASLISRVIAERQASGDAKVSAATDRAAAVEERSSQLLGKIRKFFAL